ncbi:MAG: Hsp20/alpha crystallin family protein [Acidimicrobiia bacterium]|nr:Hsp20/alpha crystallin family protein [Acidimicrobiia bacterium]
MTPLTVVPMTLTDGPDFPDQIQRLLDELAADLPRDPRGYRGECRPSLDVVETEAQIEIIVDVPGLPADLLRVACHEDVVLIVGDKRPGPACSGGEACHLLEREFGRFGRAVRIGRAFDTNRGRAVLSDGELSIVVPRVAERSGHLRRLPIEAAPTAS